MKHATMYASKKWKSEKSKFASVAPILFQGIKCFLLKLSGMMNLIPILFYWEIRNLTGKGCFPEYKIAWSKVPNERHAS